MKRALIFSLAGHAAAFAGALVAVPERPHVLPGKVYTVEVVAAPGLRPGGGGAALRQPPAPPVQNRARSGVKVDKAPSSEKAAPRGVKKPKAAIEKSGQPARGGGSGIGKEGGGGLRVEGQAFPYPGYLDTLRLLITEQWQQRMIDDAGLSLKATVFFTLDRDGTVLECEVRVPSGVFEFDDAARRAVFQASPVQPLPGAFKGTGLGVNLDFHGD